MKENLFSPPLPLPRTQGFSLVVNSDVHLAGAVSSPEVIPCSQVILDEPTVLVLGSEGKGLRTTVKVRSRCHER